VFTLQGSEGLRLDERKLHPVGVHRARA
jgi:hypothetical protein